MQRGYYFVRYIDDFSADAWFIVSVDDAGCIWQTGLDVAIDRNDLEFGRRIDIEKERR